MSAPAVAGAGCVPPRLEPLAGPACWRGADLHDRDDWIHRLSAGERAALDRGAQRVAGRPLAAIDADDLPLAELAPRLAEIRASMLEGAGVALLKGAPVAGRTPDHAERVLWGIGLHLGIAQPQDAAGALMHHVRDTGVGLAGRDDTRTYETSDAQPWHNDGGDVFALLCRATSAAGGRSRIASASSAFNVVLDRDPDLARALQEPFWFDARGQQLPGRAPVQRAPVFTFHEGRMYVLHKRHYVELAQRFAEVPRLSARQSAALDALDAACDDPQVHLEFDLEPGDVEIGHNFSLLHARTAFRDASRAREGRHLLRLWLGLPDGWPLPEVYRDTREFGPLLAIRAGRTGAP